MSDLPKDNPTAEDAHRALGSSDKHNASQYIHNAEAKIKRLQVALRRCARNDKTRYEHHEKRPFDNKGPEPDGTIWLTPREIARGVLREPELATTADAINLAS